MADQDQNQPSQTAALPVVIKKYANRRLYNTATSSYVTLDHLCEMVKKGDEFVVYDAKTGEDITRSVLTQIIFEQEGKGQSMLPINFLRQVIGFYGDNLQHLVPGYLDLSMSSFSKNQEQLRNYLTDTFGDMNPFRNLEDISRQNLAMIQRAVNLFSPFGQGQAAPTGAKGGSPSAKEEDITSLKEKLDAMQRQLQELMNKKS